MPRPKNPNPKPAYRPQKKIDWDEVDKYLLAQVPGTWIAASIGIHPNTLYERCDVEKGMSFSEYSQSKMSHGKAIGMMKQFQGMLKGNTQLTLHFASHHLGQSSKSEIKQEVVGEITTIEITKPILELPDNGHSFINVLPPTNTCAAGASA